MTKITLSLIVLTTFFWPFQAIAFDSNTPTTEASVSNLKTATLELERVRDNLRDMWKVIILSGTQARVQEDQKLASIYDDLSHRCSDTIAVLDHAADLIKIASAQDSLTEDAFFVIVTRLNMIASELNDHAKLQPEFQNEYRKANKSVSIAHSQNLEKYMKTIQEIIQKAVRNLPLPANLGK